MDEQNKNKLVYALDIGTRSIVGVVGEENGGKLNVLDVEIAEHGGRAMKDGQIDNIQQVAELARKVTNRLEEKLGIKLSQVSIAAAGRSLQTQRGSFTLEFSSDQVIDDEIIGRLESGAVSNAEEALQVSEKEWKQMLLIGYTVSQYRLDNYPLTALRDHKGRNLQADVVATFLPGEVIESLYAAMKAAGLQVTSMTLEPIAAMNAAIPAELRLLNLVLVDIGAGTTDIAICRDGGIVGYTMTTIAGDEITETLMQKYLIDFATAERIKKTMKEGETASYIDILGMENTISYEEFIEVIKDPLERLTQSVAEQIVELNNTLPSAVFLAGGGSKLCNIKEKVAESLGMDAKRVALTGTNFERSAYSKDINLDNPEYTTPLGIAVSVGLGLLNDSYFINLNGEPAKLFRSGVLTVKDILLMNGYTYRDMIGRNGSNITVMLDNRRIVMRGEPSTPATLYVNGKESTISTVVNIGDKINFTPAGQGKDASITLGEFLSKQFSKTEENIDEIVGRVLVNNQEAELDMQLSDQDVVLVLDRVHTTTVNEEKVVEGFDTTHVVYQELKVQEVQPIETVKQVENVQQPQQIQELKKEPVIEKNYYEQAVQQPSINKKSRTTEIVFNGKSLILPEKEQPYLLMDLLQYSEIDFEHIDKPVRLLINNVDGGFCDEIKTGDNVQIFEE